MENTIMVLLVVLMIICVVNLLLIVKQKNSACKMDESDFEMIKNKMIESQSILRQEIGNSIQNTMRNIGEMISKNQKEASERQKDSLESMNNSINEKQSMMNENVQAHLKQMEERLKTFETTNEQKLAGIRETVSKGLADMQEDNSKKLDEIRNTVDEKLQKTLEDRITNSFKVVSDRLEQVHKGLGEMQNIASGVGDLKKVLSNVKTRGILGEIQLATILSEILTPEQYDTEVSTIPGSSERVEFAIKLPGKEDGKYIYLPIDSKFPGDTYAALQDAYENGDSDGIKQAYKKLEDVIKKCAKDIRDKYLSPPYTTNFAVMFLPFEGLYAEVVNHSLVEVLQRDYNVNIAGPSTMAAMLNSLQMGFQTLQIQKRSNEVWNTLSEVKKEFDKFEEVFQNARKRISQLDNEMEKLIGVRTRAIQRKLRDVGEIEDGGTEALIDVRE